MLQAAKDLIVYKFQEICKW